MEEFKIIYKILKYLKDAMDLDVADEKEISCEKLGITQNKWSRIIEMMYNEGYIDGVHIILMCGNQTPGIKFDNLRITLYGLEYLEDNTLMKKAARLVKGIKDTIPGL